MEGRGFKLRMSETMFSFGLLIEVFKRDPMVFIEKIKNRHGRTAGRASNGIITESRDNSASPGSKGGKSFMLFSGDGSANASIGMAMASVEAIITDHLEMLFRDVADELFDEQHSRDSLMDQDIIFVSVVMESNSVSSLVVGIDTGSGNNGTAKIAADVVEDSGGIAFVVFGINIEAVFRIVVDVGFETLEIRRKFLLEKI